MTLTKILCCVFAIVSGAPSFADELPPLEAYGKLPKFGLFALSPSLSSSIFQYNPRLDLHRNRNAIYPS